MPPASDEKRAAVRFDLTVWGQRLRVLAGDKTERRARSRTGSPYPWWYLMAVVFAAGAVERLLAARDRVDRGGVFTSVNRRNHLWLIVLQGGCLLAAAGLACALALGVRPRRDALLGLGLFLVVAVGIALVPDLMSVSPSI